MPEEKEQKARLYTVTGMSCAACSSRVEKAVNSTDGVEKCAVNLLTGDLRVEGTADDTAVILAVERAGYGCEIRNEKAVNRPNSTKARSDEEKKIIKRFLFSVSLLIPLLYLSMGIQMLHLPEPELLCRRPLIKALLQFILSSAVLLTNRIYFINGWKGIRNHAPNMDTLVSLGSGISWAWSLAQLSRMCLLFSPENPMEEAVLNAEIILENLYFESAAMIPVMITLGKSLEARAKGETTNAVNRLKQLRPQTAHLLTPSGEVTVQADQLQPGDVFLLKPGEAVPADGWIRNGNSWLDESMLTGESCQVRKTAAVHGDRILKNNRVYAATINKSGFLECVCDKSSKDSVLSQIIQMVTDAASTKAPVSKLADKAAAVFVPAVLMISALTFILWLWLGETTDVSLTRAVSVLVISCPCALGLATPVALMVGSGTAAKNGILFKNAEAMEITGKAGTAVFDKTGTLTEGRYSVSDVLPSENSSEGELLQTAVTLESAAEHPLAIAITEYGRRKSISAGRTEDFKADGSGISAMTPEGPAEAGGRRIAAEAGVPEEELKRFDELVKKKTEEGKTAVYFVCNKKLKGVICCTDQIREEAAFAVAQLTQLGIQTVLLSGDHQKTARTAASLVGIEQVKAEVLPGEKAETIRELQKNGIVLMVGDGINDAPGLTAADIGIAVAAGTDIAMDAADVVLMKSMLTDVPAAVRLSRQILRVIRQNLFWAFFYNLICIPIAAGVFAKNFGISLNPMICSAAMSFSSIFVVLNALRLNFYSPYRETERTESNDSHRQERVKKEENTLMEIKVKGMMCPHCEARVKAALEKVNGVTEAEVSFEKGNAVVKGTADRKELVKAITEAGYEAEEL